MLRKTFDNFLVFMHLNNVFISAINRAFIREKKGYKVGKCVRCDQWPHAGISCAPHLNVGVKEETPEIPGDCGRSQEAFRPAHYKNRDNNSST